MNTLKRFIAVAAALTLTTTGTSVLGAGTNIRSDMKASAAVQKIPGWVPYDFNSALNFANTYGSTLVKNDLACLVLKVSDSENAYLDISYSGTAAEAIDDEIIYNEKFYYEEPVPVPGNDDVIRYSSINGDPGYHYQVYVYDTKSFSTLDVTVKTGQIIKGEPQVTKSTTYTFARNGINGGVAMTQDDIFGWLPDSITEFNAYVKENGKVSTHGEYLIYCGEVSPSTGESLDVAQNGTAKLEEVMSFYADEQETFPRDGGANNIVKVYKAKSAGSVDVAFRNVLYDDTVICETKRNITVDKDLIPLINTDDLPDWVPQDFCSAVKFDYAHGTTYAADGYVCIVHRIYGDTGKWKTYCRQKDNSTSLAPNYVDTEPVFKKDFVSDDKSGMYGDVTYAVEVYKPVENGNLKITLDFRGTGSMSDKLFDFDIKDGVITETDMYGWLPDSVTEATDFIQKNGDVSVHGEYAVYCGEIPISANYDINIHCDGTTWLVQDEYYSVNRLDDAPGTPTMTVVLYKAKKKGDTTVTFSVESKNEENKGTPAFDPIEKTFRIDNDLNIKIIDKEDKTPLIKGDSNYDGSLGIADVVALQQYLLGNYPFINFENSDMNGDGRVNAFDLVLLKRMTFDKTSKFVSESEPLIAVVYENHAWGAAQQITLYDQNGKPYRGVYVPRTTGESDSDIEKNWGKGTAAYDKLIDFREGEGWYEQLLAIMKDEEKYAGGIDPFDRLPDEVVYDSRELVKKIDSIKDSKWGRSISVMCDGGYNSVYIFGKSEGKPVVAEICATGDSDNIRYNADVHEFIKTLLQNDCIRFSVDYHMLMEEDVVLE